MRHGMFAHTGFGFDANEAAVGCDLFDLAPAPGAAG
jgi:hypothetical protein